MGGDEPVQSDRSDRLAPQWPMLASAAYADHSASLVCHWRMGFQVSEVHGLLWPHIRSNRTTRESVYF